jgi:uncharacterized membrane protein YbhN (UPF0104 family)
LQPAPGDGRPDGPRATRPWLGYLVAASIGFAIVFLVRLDRVPPVRIRSWGAFLGSGALLVAGFVGQAATWWVMVNRSGYPSPAAHCLAGTGLSIFTKYIPGKVFVVVGRAMYLASRLDHPLASVSMVSLNAQLLALWAGLTLGAVGLTAAGRLGTWMWAVVGGWGVLTVAALSPGLRLVVERLVGKLLARPWDAPRLTIRSIAALLPWFFAYWSAWALGFHLFLLAVSDPGIPGASWAAFPVATTVGIAALFAPGGLGVAEGTMVVVLAGIGWSAGDAAVAAVYTRLWLIAGESAMFLIGFGTDRLVRSRA